MTKKQEMKNYVNRYPGSVHTATGLAREMGWTKKYESMYDVKDDKGKVINKETVTKVSQNSTAALRLAKKCGAKVTRNPSSLRHPRVAEYEIIL